MSKYTTELRYILESYAGLEQSEGNDRVEEIITAGMPRLFDFTLPIFDANYASVLESKICRHFYTREIGYETVGRFKLGLRTKLIEILPYYNQLYESQLIKLNPLRNYSVNKTHVDSGGTRNVSGSNFNREETNENTGTKTINNKYNNETANKERFSDTPNGTLADIEDNTYLSSATLVDNAQSGKTQGFESNADANKSNTKGGSQTTDTFTTNMQYIEQVAGLNGISESDLLMKFRDTFLNIDMKIIDELEPLFMQIW